MSRQPNRARSRRVVFAAAVFLAVVVTGHDEDCAPPSTAESLATLTFAGRLLGVLGRGIALLSLPGKDSGCGAAS
ncbi:hypothetical protein [Lentzea sp. NPDC003310]|uniref:hypothetical protein n=1 Tax=Lentzea sp. NPDC003310 TaxID=3154447 RepID=UPI0033B94A2E